MATIFADIELPQAKLNGAPLALAMLTEHTVNDTTFDIVSVHETWENVARSLCLTCTLYPVMEEPPLSGVLHPMTMFYPSIQVEGANGLAGTSAALIVTSFDS